LINFIHAFSQSVMPDHNILNDNAMTIGNVKYGNHYLLK